MYLFFGFNNVIITTIDTPIITAAPTEHEIIIIRLNCTLLSLLLTLIVGFKIGAKVGLKVIIIGGVETAEVAAALKVNVAPRILLLVCYYYSLMFCYYYNYCDLRVCL